MWQRRLRRRRAAEETSVSANGIGEMQCAAGEKCRGAVGRAAVVRSKRMGGRLFNCALGQLKGPQASEEPQVRKFATGGEISLL